MKLQEHDIQIVGTDSKCSDVSASDLTKMLFERQSSGLAELYEKLNKSISINSIIESSKAFQKMSKSMRQTCP